MTANRGNILETRYRKLWDKTDLDATIFTGYVPHLIKTGRCLRYKYKNGLFYSRWLEN